MHLRGINGKCFYEIAKTIGKSPDDFGKRTIFVGSGFVSNWRPTIIPDFNPEFDNVRSFNGLARAAYIETAVEGNDPIDNRGW